MILISNLQLFGGNFSAAIQIELIEHIFELIVFSFFLKSKKVK
jgi:hypothetical protein